MDLSVALLLIGAVSPQEFLMAKRTIAKINKEIAHSKEVICQEWKRLFIRIAILLAITAIVGLVCHLLLPECHFTEHNTVTIVGICKSVKRMEVGVDSKTVNWIQFELNDGNTYEIGSDQIKLTESELVETFQGKELTIRTESDNSARILALSDPAQVYYSLNDTNEVNRFNRTIIFGILFGITGLSLLLLIGFGVPMDEIRFLRHRRQEKAELEARNNQSKGGTT
jgi:hypothetical protein